MDVEVVLLKYIFWSCTTQSKLRANPVSSYDPVPIPHMLSQPGRINWSQLYCKIKRGIEGIELKRLRNRGGLCRDGEVYRYPVGI